MIFFVILNLIFSLINAFELPNFTQFNESSNKIKKRAVLRDSRFKWSRNIIVYYISRDLPESPIILAHMKIEKYTCLKFKRTFNKYKAHLIYKAGGMYLTYLGKRSDYQQKIYIPRGDMHFSKIARETLCALGFDYEHNRPDRDFYITIITKHILLRYLKLFSKQKPTDIETYGLGYDYRSIMHYGSRELCHYGTQCIKANNKNALIELAMGKSTELTFNDAKLINFKYCLSLLTIRRSKCLHYGYPYGVAPNRCLCIPYFTGHRCEYFMSNFEYCTTKNVLKAKKKSSKKTLNAGRNCYYQIKTKKGRRIVLYVRSNDFNPKNSICDENQNIEIRYKTDISVSGTIICPKAIPYMLKSHSNMVIIHTKYDSKNYKISLYYKEF